jgi:hypothetical protein
VLQHVSQQQANELRDGALFSVGATARLRASSHERWRGWLPSVSLELLQRHALPSRRESALFLRMAGNWEMKC